MAAHWNDTLLRASYRRARSWTIDHPILFYLITAVPPVLIPAGVFGLFGLVEGLVTLLVVPALMFLVLVWHTHLQMLYEVRRAIGAQLAGDADAVADGVETTADFAFELVEDPPPGQVLVRVVNRDATADFQAKVMSVDGVDPNGTWPITARWLADGEARSRRISRGDSEVINLVRVRTKRAVDFLRPVSADKEYQRVSVVENGSSARVRAHLTVFNQRDDAEDHRSCDLELIFANGSDEPEARLLPFGPGGAETG
ncbi:MAG: hypothetical protein AAGA93_16670 [Actinomycetota bacterium]